MTSSMRKKTKKITTAALKKINKLYSTPAIPLNVEMVIRLLGTGALLTATIIFPALPMALKPFFDAKREAERDRWQKEWERYNPWLLRQTLKRLYNQKIVKIIDEGDGSTVILTKKGQTRYLHYQLEDMLIKRPPRWDGKWRLIIYDIAIGKKRAQELFRQTLKRLKFFQLQKSVYLTPFPCHDEIEFLRQYYGIGEEVYYCVVEHLENDSAFRKFFGL